MKPNYKSASFWSIAALTILSALSASGAVDGVSALNGGIGYVVAALLATGYASVRAFKKGEDGKRAYKTTEFWLSIVAALVCLIGSSGVFAPSSSADKVLGTVSSLLAALGYVARYQLPPKA